jgi:adenylate cyclase
MARQFWITGDFGDRRREERVIRLCKLATEIDPQYAQAWALLALAQANLVFGFMGAEPVDDGLAAAERAISLNPEIAEARLPKAWHFAERGEHDKAAAELETAVRLGPDSWEVNKEAARLSYRLRRIDEATRYLERATSLVEDDFHGWGMLMACYSAKGDEAGVRRCAEELNSRIPEVLVRAPDNGAALIFGALALAITGNADRADEWIERGLLLDPKNMMMRYNLAWGLAKIFKDDAAAIKAIAPVFEQGGRNIIRLAANDPNLDGLRDDPSFKEPLAAAKSRVGLAQQ